MFKPFLFVVFICGALMPLTASNFPELLEGSPDELKNPYKTICETPDLFYNEDAVKDMLRNLLAANTVDDLKAACVGKNATVLELLFLCKGGEAADGQPFKTDAMLKTLARLVWTQNAREVERKVHTILYETSGVKPKKTQVTGKLAAEPGTPHRQGGNTSHHVIFDLSVAAENNALARASLRQRALAGLTFGDPAHEIGKDEELKKQCRDRMFRFMTADEKKAYEDAQLELAKWRKSRN